MTEQRLFELARRLAELRDTRNRLDSEVSTVNQEIAKVNDEMTQIMVNTNCHRFNLDGRTFYSAVESIPKIVDESGFVAWLDAHGEASIIKRTVHASTLKAWYREHAEQYEEELKNGLLEIFERIQVRMRREGKQ